MARQSLETEQKALEINLDDKIYGTFAEIGAGQEVARYFFQVGAAAGTIAKTMSAYDKVYSDKIYGIEATGRYVCESRVYKMLDHEYELMVNRLRNERPDTNFFVFADTVAAINYSRTIKGDGWLGLRFQLQPNGAFNELVLHVKMLDNDNGLQQQAIGILGVNMVYACYRYNDDPETLIVSLMDSLQGRISIDMLRLIGPNFNKLDNKIIPLWLVKNKMCDVSMLNEEGRPVHASEFLYKKNILVVRGSYRPATLVNMDMIQAGYEQFRNEPNIDPKRTSLLTEITLENLVQSADLDEQDYLDRTAVLCELGQTVMITNCEKHHKLINYLSDYRIQKLGMVIGVQELLKIINEKYSQHLNGNLLAAFGELFTQNVKFYIYPAFQEGSAELMSTSNIPIPEDIKFLFKHLLDSEHIVDVKDFKKEHLHIYSKYVLELLQSDKEDWENMVPSQVAKLIKEKCLFNFPSERLEFEY